MAGPGKGPKNKSAAEEKWFQTQLKFSSILIIVIK